MKKSIFTKLTSLTVTAAIVMSFTSFIHADVTEDAGDPQEMISEDITVEEFAVPESDFDNDELAAKYIMNKMSGGSEATYRKYDLSGYLEQYDKTIFNYIVPVISDIASGNQTSAVIIVPEDVLSVSFSNSDLGVEDFSALSVDEAKALVSQNMPIHSSKIMNALLFASPYDLYWFDKTTGMGMTYSFSRSRTTLRLYNFTFYFYVANEYQGRNNLEVSSEYGEAVSAAASNANTIIENNAGLDDYSKLLAYNNEICKLTDYNYSAAGGGVAYGNPWQLVWVFDGDPDTKVVCEGYSKAFQYLCDNSVFRCSDLYTISVSGYLAGEGHMWNIVHMDDEKNYVVDITNSDPGGEGNYGSRLFLIGAVSGSVSSGYTLKNGYLYTYKTSTMNSYSEDVITISSADYNPNAEYSLTLEGEVDSSSLSKSKAKAGEEISVSYTLPVGKELESILVNGKAIDGTTFTMPAMDTTVVVTFKKADYKITVSDTTGGTAYTDKTVANYEDLITVTATPDTGYKLDAIKVDGITIDGNSFEMPAADVTVEVTFVKIDYAVTVNCTAGGTASAPDTANYGDEITVSVTPDTGYELDTIKVNDVAIAGNSFTMPASDVTVEVIFKKADYKITLNAGEGGSVQVPSGANYGDDIEITATPDTGYKLDAIKVDGITIDGNSFVMPASDVTVDVTFVNIDYAVTVSYSTGGTASAQDTANYGDEITVTVTPDTGYELDTIKINDAVIDGNSFTMPASDVTVEVTFKKISYTVSITNTSGGSANVDKTTAYYGEEIEIDIAIEEGYHLDSILVNGTAIDGDKFTMPAGNVTIEVIFNKNEYTITVSDVTGGTASASAEKAGEGEEITVTVTPDKGYELDKIKVNNTVITGTKFTMPASNVTVEVTFKKVVYKISLNSSGNGTVNLSKTKANYGDEITVEITPASGYELSKITVKTADGSKVNVTDNTFVMPDANVTVSVTFAKISYGIIVEDNGLGTVDVVSSAIKGNHIIVDISPAEGCELESLTAVDSEGNDIEVTDNSFTMPGASVTITAVFRKIDYTITIVCSDHGTATVSGNPANFGDEITVTALPDNGFELNTIKVDDEIIEGNTFTMPAKDITITVTFRDRTYSLNGWILEDGKYYFYENGKMVKGWIKSGSSWYYMDTETGAMVTGWKNAGGKWYYFTGSGAMVTGWQKIGGTWYFFESSGAMATGWKESGGKWYYFTGSGAMVTGWQKIGGTWYYFESSGAMATGWKNSGGKWYYFTSSGAMQTGWKQSGSDWYYLDTSSGAMVTGWKSISGKWYYFYDSGVMAYSTTIDGYTLGTDGAMI